MRAIQYTLVLLFVSFATVAQNPNFRSPVNIPILLNGNFGELRNTHFHAGIDIKTNGTTGLPIYSIENGYVSRVSVSPAGYGNVLYINHPSGFTSVYGHLEKFAPEIAKWVKLEQYAQKKFTVDLIPEKDQFKVKKGEIVAYSGNSGSSGGPHLHFEIRNTITEHPINPLLFPFQVQDKSKPHIGELVIYPISDDSQVQNHTKAVTLKAVQIGNEYVVNGGQSVKVYGDIGFGVDAIDYLDGTWSKCGIYKIQVLVDKILIHQFTLDSLNYETNNDYRSHIDYALKMETGRKIHRCVVDPGNQLFNYDTEPRLGIFRFDDAKSHLVELLVYDVKGNSSKLKFEAIATKPITHEKISAKEKFSYRKANRYETPDCVLDFPVGSFFTDIDFNFYTDTSYSGGYSPIFKIHRKETPLRNPVQIAIKARDLPERLYSKAFIAMLDEKTWKKSYLGGSYSKGWVKTNSRFFGNYCIAVDTIAPRITSLSIKDHRTLNEPNQLRFKVTDDLSDIENFNGYIDGEWVLFAYDAKRNLLSYVFDGHVQKGKKHEIKLQVTDAKQNISEYRATFYW